jgi:flavin-dependent dehydrogenase
MEPRSTNYDAIVIGGGPGGATAALALARAGKSVLVLERAGFPRFHIGESLLPYNMPVFRELGLEEALATVPRVDKHGAEFALGHGATGLFYFRDSLGSSETSAYNLERAPFDAMLLDAARAAGAEVVEGRAVRALPRLADGDVAVALDDGGEVAGRFLIDASGQATVVGKHLGLRRRLPDLEKAAYFGHFENVRRREGVEGGFIVIVMADEGWFWLIPLDETRTSIGVVMEARVARGLGLSPQQVLPWAIARCPAVRERTAAAVFPQTYHVAADFSYRCAPCAGPGYFLVGDAATFVDPIFSTGVCLAMRSAVQAAHGVLELLDGARPAPVRRRYVRFVEGSTAPFFRMIRLYYRHSFRELFLEGQGPLDVHRAVIAVLAGAVFPRPAWRLRWRLRLFELFVRVNDWWPLGQRRERFSLLAEPRPAVAEPAPAAPTG